MLTFDQRADILQLMKKKLLAAFLFICSGFLFSPTGAQAAKQRLRREQGGTTVRRIYTRGARASVKFRPDRRGLLLSFSGLGSAVSITYTLTYTGNGMKQGVTGTVTPETAGEQRELLFGTCSHGVCHYHQDIKDARLVIDSKLSSGLTVRKPYRIKV